MEFENCGGGIKQYIKTGSNIIQDSMQAKQTAVYPIYVSIQPMRFKCKLRKEITKK